MNYDNGYASYGYSQPYAHQNTAYPTSNSDQSHYGGPQYTQYQDTTYQQQSQHTLDAFYIPNSGQQNSWGASSNNSMGSQPYGFDTSQHSGFHPAFNAQSTPAQCTCGFYNGHHVPPCPHYHNGQGNNSNPTTFGYNTADTQSYSGYNQQINTPTYDPHSMDVPGGLSPNYSPTVSNSATPAPMPLPSPTVTLPTPTTPAQASPPQPVAPQKLSSGKTHHKSGLAAAWTGAVAGVGSLGAGIGQLFRNAD
ncbi:hypothetical protein H2198_001253 [Neophaeococcomyces mojaviensis]|uniref:Uncharacterized protein n=1 Tax=Neophaeococcomyces mojaviensis TaxID=3383035 RepID=A0ACC3AHP4_9EURO|nr:hypothetical protein H2198_001253 [Knufia sp. JES_112]